LAQGVLGLLAVLSVLAAGVDVPTLHAYEFGQEVDPAPVSTVSGRFEGSADL